ncbi:exosortase A [Ectothiorhodospira lacustris]|uniref:exosortase A n=1 Tax=Ectothiorhodospira lacustris TaxID=2899127 RepID=UPI001EE79D22|nr:exosortase A [Ectothiorhodospira lacustris]MCG5510326.1 exosortase A [Ectothiorhodospira lacustris]MCG5522072.1 exosortase A [Ectothiorhodospira lacustris]
MTTSISTSAENTSAASAASAAPRTPDLSWPLALGLLVAGMGAMVLLYWPSVQKLVHIWLNSDTYAHGMVILPISLFLAWRMRHQLAALTPRPSYLGILLIAALGLGWTLARAADVTVVQTFVVVAMVPTLVITVLGLGISRALTFPLAYIFFAWPVGSFLVPILQDYTAWFTVLMLRLTGLPVYAEGYYISIPAGDFVVAEVCSGIRYLIASVALGLVYAYLIYRSLWRRLVFTAFAIVIPIVANGLRAYGIIMIAHWTDMEHAVGVDHLIYGWLFFGVVMFLLFWVGSLFREDDLPQPEDQRRAMMKDEMSPSKAAASPVFLPLTLAAVVLVMAPLAELGINQRMAALAGDRYPAAPQVMGWTAPRQDETPAWQPRFAEPDYQSQHAYRSENGHELALHVLHYHHDQPGTDLITHGNRIYDGQTWRRVSNSGRTVTLPGGEQHGVRETILRGPGDRGRIVWHWYQVADRPTARPIEVKLLEAWARLSGHRDGSLLVAVTTEFQLTPDEGRVVLQEFLIRMPGLIDVEYRPESGS